MRARAPPAASSVGVLMSAVAFAFSIFPEMHKLVTLLATRYAYHSRAERLAYGEYVGYLSDTLSRAVRSWVAAHPGEDLAAAVDTETLDAVIRRAAASTTCPALASPWGHDRALRTVPSEVESALRSIILSAPTGVPRRGRGRPRNSPALLARAQQLHAEGRTYKEIARAVSKNSPVATTPAAIRAMLARAKKTKSAQ